MRSTLILMVGLLAATAVGCGKDDKATIPTKNYAPPGAESSESSGGKGKVKNPGESAKEG